MGTKQKKVIVLSWAVVLLSAFLWTFSDSIRVFIAVIRHPELGPSSMNLAEPARTEFKRNEQKYFLQYGIYVPLEDIMYVEQLPDSGVRYAESLRLSCADISTKNGIAIWLPIKSKWPLFGERVFEWCWKPPVSL